MKAQPFSWKARLKSFNYAVRGIAAFMRSEHNAWIHLAASVTVCIAGFYYRLNKTEWIAVLFCIALVWITEMVNTCIEKIMNHLSPQHSEAVKQIKDIAAGAVLVAAVFAAITGCVIFVPRFL
jgi:diacylglycerol kinase